MIYLQAGLEIRFSVPYAIYWECNRESHVLGYQGSPWASAWRRSKLGPRMPKWQNGPTRAIVLGRKPWLSFSAKP